MSLLGCHTYNWLDQTSIVYLHEQKVIWWIWWTLKNTLVSQFALYICCLREQKVIWWTNALPRCFFVFLSLTLYLFSNLQQSTWHTLGHNSPKPTNQSSTLKIKLSYITLGHNSPKPTNQSSTLEIKLSYITLGHNSPKPTNQSSTLEIKQSYITLGHNSPKPTNQSSTLEKQSYITRPLITCITHVFLHIIHVLCFKCIRLCIIHVFIHKYYTCISKYNTCLVFKCIRLCIIHVSIIVI